MSKNFTVVKEEGRVVVAQLVFQGNELPDEFQLRFKLKISVLLGISPIKIANPDG